MHIIASQPIGSGHEEAVKAAVVDRIPERIQAWTMQTGPTYYYSSFEFSGRTPLGMGNVADWLREEAV
jgi:hypothetical protein